MMLKKPNMMIKTSTPPCNYCGGRCKRDGIIDPFKLNRYFIIHFENGYFVNKKLMLNRMRCYNCSKVDYWLNRDGEYKLNLKVRKVTVEAHDEILKLLDAGIPLKDLTIYIKHNSKDMNSFSWVSVVYKKMIG